jgi:hypothetical protein
MQPLTDKFYPGGRNPDDLPLHVHLDNCRIHYSKRANAFFSHKGIVRVPQPGYSPDLAPSNFWLFGDMKRSLANKHFTNPEDLLAAIADVMEEVPVKLGSAFLTPGWNECAGLLIMMETIFTDKPIPVRNSF